MENIERKMQRAEENKRRLRESRYAEAVREHYLQSKDEINEKRQLEVLNKVVLKHHNKEKAIKK